jgi:glycosyltransferase involved in cell wall biosynthesis
MLYVVIAAFNEGKKIGSVISDLQKHGYKNIVVVDDGSEDDTYDVCSKHKVHLLRHIINMGQQEVFNFLKKHTGKWFTSKDISNMLDVSLGSVTNNLKKLRKTEKSFLKVRLEGNKYFYMFKH